MSSNTEPTNNPTPQQLHADALMRVDAAIRSAGFDSYKDKAAALETGALLLSRLTLSEYTLRRRRMAKWFGIEPRDLDRMVRHARKIEATQ